VFELFPCHLASDEPGDTHHCFVYPRRFPAVAIIVRGWHYAASAIFILNHRRPPPERIPEIQKWHCQI